MDWTEKYRPHGLADLVGNGPSVKKMQAWAQAWMTGKPAQRALILSGPPGVGKTSAALALAHDMDWAVIELNASDARNADVIRRVATAGALHQTFADDGSFRTAGEEGGRKLIILDEADNLYERMKSEASAGSDLSDRGGKTQIIDTIKRTQQPIILIVNDLYELQKGSGSSLKQLAEVLKFTRVNVRSIPKALLGIADAEGIKVDPIVLQAVAEKAGGDLRAAVRDFESLCTGRTEVTVQHLGDVGYRDSSGTIFDVIRHILKGKPMDQLRREVMDVDGTPADMVLWVDENLGKEYRDPRDLVAGYEMLARADQFLGRTKRTQNYRLWAYASDLATVGVMSVREQKYNKFVPFGFPQWLSKMSRSKGTRNMRDSLAGAVGAYTHSSKRVARNEQMDTFITLFKSQPAFQVNMTFELELDDDQVANLLGERKTSARVKEIRADVAELLETRRVAKPKPFGGLTEFADEEPVDRVENAPVTEASNALEPEAEPEVVSEPESKKPTPSKGQQRLF